MARASWLACRDLGSSGADDVDAGFAVVVEPFSPFSDLPLKELFVEVLEEGALHQPPRRLLIGCVEVEDGFEDDVVGCRQVS